jgi:hypothetical protein
MRAPSSSSDAVPSFAAKQLASHRDRDEGSLSTSTAADSVAVSAPLISRTALNQAARLIVPTVCRTVLLGL